MSRLAVRDLTVRYGPTTALDTCSLTVEPGELVVVLGPSGCGKSTLLRAIAGLVPSNAGTIHIEDTDVTSLPPASRDVAMVFQGYALFPHLDVRSNIGFGLRARKRPADEIRSLVAEIAGVLGIGDLLQRRPHELSGGERQRVALARALVRAPRLALLDEPLANLDAPLRVSARGEIARLQRLRQTTMIHVTHDQAEAMALGDRVAIMRDGGVVQVGTPTEVYDHPADVFVATFVGNPPMNILADSDGSIGVRPEHVIFGDTGSPATIDRVEHMGDHDLVAAQLAGGNTIVARTPRNSVPAPGEPVNVSWERSIRFDASGVAVG